MTFSVENASPTFSFTHVYGAQARECHLMMDCQGGRRKAAISEKLESIELSPAEFVVALAHGGAGAVENCIL